MTESAPLPEQPPESPVLTWAYIRRGQLQHELQDYKHIHQQAEVAGEATEARQFKIRITKTQAALSRLMATEGFISAAEDEDDLSGCFDAVSSEIEALEARILTTNQAVETLGERVTLSANFENHLATTEMRAERDILCELQHVLTNVIELDSF